MFFALPIARRAPWDAYIDLSTRGALDLRSRRGHSGTVPSVTLPIDVVRQVLQSMLGEGGGPWPLDPLFCQTNGL